MLLEMEKFKEEELEEARKLFSRKCSFVLGVARLDQLPDMTVNEVAFAGRSNVGKSSIINAITNYNRLAKTSNTPGRTQQLNYFNLDDRIYIVDLPGYGFAKAPLNIVKQWQSLITTYLQGRQNLRRVFVLIDSRHGVKKVDNEIMAMLDTTGVTYQLILTKTDKINRVDLEKVIKSTKEVIAKHTAAYPRLIATSSEKGFGIDELRAEIVSLI